ncbi:MAG: DUF1592 domain-containing protein [Bryobacterales bacterium]|nr:DUF1592 domain-containing protein [Bryobacterales bacterium]
MIRSTSIACFAAMLALAVCPAAAAPDPGAFAEVVQPLFEVCAACHSPSVASGGMIIEPFLAPSSLEEQEHREGWERILRKVRSGEMPPPGIPRPPAEHVDALVEFVEHAFEEADRYVEADPGRVTARRLNRIEYANTIRDLLGVPFHAEKDFPSDDRGHGFDNIGDVLTISPFLMEKYMAAAEHLAATALGMNRWPAEPVEADYQLKYRTARRVGLSVIEATHRVNWDGEYTIRFGLPGERAEDAAPVEFGFWMDGKLLHSMPVETKPSGLVYFSPHSLAEMRLNLPAGDHVFRAGFINDEFIKTLPRDDWFDRKKNKFVESITFVGPFPPTVDNVRRQEILSCDPGTGPRCVRDIVANLARRAYRRPVSDSEIADLLQFVEIAKGEGMGVEEGMRLALQAMLVSPNFLFRVEVDPDPTDPAAAHRISDIELASRLSYFLWSSMPDDELLAVAEDGTLSDPDVLEEQVERMLADEKAVALGENFAGQWLQIRNLHSVTPDPDKFPAWNSALRDDMMAETVLFFNHMLRENRPLGDFLDADFTFVNDRLAQLYGIDGVSGPEFRQVALPSDERGGILGHASVLTVTSYPSRTSPTIRGKYLLENILGAPPPPPPPDVPALEEAAVASAASLREQMEQHRSNAVCASCHARMDALGFALETYDGIGRWRTKDGDMPVDASGVLPNGKALSGPAELRAVLKEDLPDFARTVTEKSLTYALGRGLERFDRITVNRILDRVEATGYGFRDLVHEVIRSPAFQMRRGEAVAEQTASAPKEVASR